MEPKIVAKNRERRRRRRRRTIISSADKNPMRKMKKGERWP